MLCDTTVYKHSHHLFFKLFFKVYLLLSTNSLDWFKDAVSLRVAGLDARCLGSSGLVHGGLWEA